MSTCIPWVSELFSTLSLMSWICAQLPQIVLNYQTKSAEGISPHFLLLWFMGDFLSFSSCLLNDAALNFQVYLSMFFLANDLTLCYQYYYYNSVYPRKMGHFAALVDEESEQQEALNHSSEVHTLASAIHIRGHGNQPKPSIVHGIGGTPLSGDSLTKEKITTPSLSLSSGEPQSPNFGSTGTSPKISTLTAAATGMLFNAGAAHAMPVSAEFGVLSSLYPLKEIAGLVLAWCCTCVYVSLRCPQLYKNYKRKSVDGILPLLFGSALLGNLTYTLSVLTSCEFLYSENRAAFFWKQLPYLLGSSGTILFDIGYFYQRFIYRDAGRYSTEMGLQEWEEEDYN